MQVFRFVLLTRCGLRLRLVSHINHLQALCLVSPMTPRTSSPIANVLPPCCLAQSPSPSVVPCRLMARSWRRPLIGRMGPRIKRREHCVNKNNIVFYSARDMFSLATFFSRSTMFRSPRWAALADFQTPPQTDFIKFWQFGRSEFNFGQLCRSYNPDVC